MADHGVLPTGFSRKSLSEILASFETENIVTFGTGVIQTPQSPLGQINGLQADIVAEVWELAEDVYQALDPDQAEGLRLDMLGRIRLVARGDNESDEDYRLGITNAGRARIDLQDLYRAVRALTGVTYVQVFVNDGDTTDANGLAGHSVAVAVLGGDDEEIARTVRQYVVPGIGTSGNVKVSTTIDGYCRTIWIVRPTPIDIYLHIQVSVGPDRNGCPPPAPGAIAATFSQVMSGDARLINGQDVTLPEVRRVVESRYPNVTVVSATGDRTDLPTALPVLIAFNEIAAFPAEKITVTVV